MSKPARSNDHSPSFSLKDLPNAFLGIFGVRTERELPYQSVIEDGRRAIRVYPEHTELCHDFKAPRQAAVDRSFDYLFSYIQGKNERRQEFAMTTPVLQRPTADGSWSTRFYLPWSAQALPAPDSKQVRIETTAQSTLAVIRFSGRPTEATVERETDDLKHWLKENGYEIAGPSVVAQFDQPFAVPFLRRNEIHIPVSRRR